MSIKKSAGRTDDIMLLALVKKNDASSGSFFVGAQPVDSFRDLKFVMGDSGKCTFLGTTSTSILRKIRNQEDETLVDFLIFLMKCSYSL